VTTDASEGGAVLNREEVCTPLSLGVGGLNYKTVSAKVRRCYGGVGYLTVYGPYPPPIAPVATPCAIAPLLAGTRLVLPIDDDRAGGRAPKPWAMLFVVP
jgi:hypothetical protein